MRLIALLALSIATVGAQTDVGKLLAKGAADAVKRFEPVADPDRSAILNCANELLKKHVNFRQDGTASAICNAPDKQFVEWKQLVVSSITAKSLNEADRLNGIKSRYVVSLTCDGHRTWDSRTNAWRKWQPTGHLLFPGSLVVESIGGKWIAVETDAMKYFTPGPGASIATLKAAGSNADLPPGMTRAK